MHAILWCGRPAISDVCSIQSIGHKSEDHLQSLHNRTDDASTNDQRPHQFTTGYSKINRAPISARFSITKCSINKINADNRSLVIQRFKKTDAVHRKYRQIQINQVNVLNGFGTKRYRKSLLCEIMSRRTCRKGQIIFY